MSANYKQLPSIQYYHASLSGPRPMDLERLDSLIPIDRPTGMARSTNQITYRTYLESIEAVLSRRWDQIMEVIAEFHTEDNFQIKEIRIITEKHGGDYHPARIDIRTEDSEVSFVMNVALTERGRDRLIREFNVLRHLDSKFPARFVPKTYFINENVELDFVGREIPVRMFLGEWFTGFHEFHVTNIDNKKSQCLMLWDMELGYREMSARESHDIYRQAASILTYYYNLEDFSEIHPWHHAAGDFVVSTSGNQVSVKLITARQYAPRVSFSEYHIENRVEALKLFFANLTIRNRLDRLDGVRDIVWADNYCLQATVEGFWAGLQMQVKTGLCSEEVLMQSRKALTSISLVDLTQVFSSILSSYDSVSPDRPVISDNLADHILHVYKIVQQTDQNL